jgi:polyisoprenoid-binding protein YceI
MKKFLAILVAVLFVTSVKASEIGTWRIVPAQSKIEFKVAQDNSIISGSFKKFDGKISFDKEQLTKSKVVIEIDVASASFSLTEANSQAQTTEWFATKNFPKAIFSAEKFTTSNDKKTFRANGNLTLKGKTVPTSVEFSFEEYGTKKARAIGKANIKRSEFAVGDRDPKKANGVKDEVEITFTISAEK